MFDSLRAYARLENTTGIRSEHSDVGLAKCSLVNKTCVPFGDPAIDFRATFSMFVDRRNDLHGSGLGGP